MAELARRDQQSLMRVLHDAFPFADRCFRINDTRVGMRVTFSTENGCRAIKEASPVLESFLQPLSYTTIIFGEAGTPLPGELRIPVLLGPPQKNRSPAATTGRSGGSVQIVLLRLESDYGFFCVENYSAGCPVKAYPGATIVHELGHARFIRQWRGVYGLEFKKLSDEEADRVENDWWESLGPSTPRRMKHDPEEPGCGLVAETLGPCDPRSKLSSPKQKSD